MKDLFKNALWFWQFHLSFFDVEGNWNADVDREVMVDGITYNVVGERQSVIQSNEEPPTRAFHHEYQSLGFITYTVNNKFIFICYFGNTARSKGFVNNRFVYSNLTLLNNTSKDEAEHFFMLMRLSF